MARRHSGFTLIELLVVIAIIAILAAILFPVLTAAKARGRDTQCISNLRQIGIGFRQYNSDWNERFMPAAGYPYNWTYRCYADVLFRGSYVKSKKIFICPSAPKIETSGSWLDKDKPDGYFLWGGWNLNYGNNIMMGGLDFRSVMSQNSPGSWLKSVPTEPMVREPSKVIYICDALWVDLYGGWQAGRIGRARERHNHGGNAVFCDGHARRVHHNTMIQWPITKTGSIRWDYR